MAILYEILAGGERPRPLARVGAERSEAGEADADRGARMSDVTGSSEAATVGASIGAGPAAATC